MYGKWEILCRNSNNYKETNMNNLTIVTNKLGEKQN